MGLKLAKEKLFHSVDANNMADVRIVLDKYPALANEYFDEQKTSLPITRACWLGRKEMVELLLERGADPKAPIKNGFNALFVAAQRGHAEIISLLIARGSPVDIADDRGFSPLDIALVYGFYNAALVLTKSVV
jgi:ankyrin repeat protein